MSFAQPYAGINYTICGDFMQIFAGQREKLQFYVDVAEVQEYGRLIKSDVCAFEKADGGADAFDIAGGQIHARKGSFHNFCAGKMALIQMELVLRTAVKQRLLHFTTGEMNVCQLAVYKGCVVHQAVFKGRILKVYGLKMSTYAPAMVKLTLAKLAIPKLKAGEITVFKSAVVKVHPVDIAGIELHPAKETLAEIGHGCGKGFEVIVFKAVSGGRIAVGQNVGH